MDGADVDDEHLWPVGRENAANHSEEGQFDSEDHGDVDDGDGVGALAAVRQFTVLVSSKDGLTFWKPTNWLFGTSQAWYPPPYALTVG